MLEPPQAAPDAGRAAAPEAERTSTPDEAAEAMPQTVTVLRGKRSRRTPLAAFHGLLQVRWPTAVARAPRAARSPAAAGVKVLTPR
jgi:hypothetical protein